MELRKITETFSVSPQITPSDVAELAASGVTTIICNRPDVEVPPDLQAAALQAAAEAAGLAFVYNPVVGMGMSVNSIEEQADAIEGSEGQVVAYCASGMRSALMWAFSQAGQTDTATLLAQLSEAGYPLDHLAGQIDGIGAARQVEE